MTHTPGPLEAVSGSDPDTYFVYGTEDIPVATTFHHPTGASAEQYAKLFAAAPDLLAALEATIADLEIGRNARGGSIFFQDLPDSVLDARKAIAKAKDNDYD